MLDELEASRASRKRAWENLQELRWVLKDVAGIKLPPPARKTIDLEGRIVKDGVRKAVADRQNALTDLLHAIQEYRKLPTAFFQHVSRPVPIESGALARRHYAEFRRPDRNQWGLPLLGAVGENANGDDFIIVGALRRPRPDDVDIAGIGRSEDFFDDPVTGKHFALRTAGPVDE